MQLEDDEQLFNFRPHYKTAYVNAYADQRLLNAQSL